MAARHESLRTSFTVVDGSPVQVIAPTLSVELPVIDLSGLPEAEREAEARRLTTAEAQRPFDLARGPVFRVSLLRLNDEQHVLLITMHHIVSDGWSIGVFMRELTALYEAFSQGQPSLLGELPIQYADYAIWQREWLAGEQLERQLSYWRKQLGSSLPELELPTDRPRPAVQSYRGATQRATLSKELTKQLRALSQREGVTLFMTLLAAFQTLLMRYSGQEDIVIGSPIANRNRIETEGLIGFFVNTLVLRTELSGNPTFRELVGRVKEVTLGAYAHQDLPFEKVVEELHPERTLSQNPLFQVVFQLMNAPRSSLKLSGLTLGSQGGTESGTAKFDLSLFVYERAEGEGLPCLLEYSTDLFNASTIERMLGHFQVLLEGIVANPNQRLCELPLLSEAERHQLLVEWNDTETEYGRDQTVAELFELQVKRTPDAIAAVYEGERLTYGELNRRANQVAHYLRGRGVRAEVLVGVMMERSLEMVIGLLGILKAGGAYVPLDAAYPQERLAFMLADAAVAMLVTEAKLVDRVPKSSEAEMICLDTEWKVIAQESPENLESGAGAENLAYVIYTSGSTGQPKGVAVQHRSIVRLVKETNYVVLTSDQVFLQFAPVSFDASTFELWGCLLNGARLVVFPAGTPSLKELGEVLQRSQVTTLWLTAG
ncbi:MAG: condensation domain-containing protein, partial [Acidobacteria bacterium]|nr:condensation domain-containing protein [Acidobacteriota bacterium]